MTSTRKLDKLIKKYGKEIVLQIAKERLSRSNEITRQCIIQNQFPDNVCITNLALHVESANIDLLEMLIETKLLLNKLDLKV